MRERGPNQLTSALQPGVQDPGLGGANHMRMNIATSRKTLEVALSNLANALKSVAPDRTLIG